MVTLERGKGNVVCGVSNKNHENISLLATALKLYTFFLYLPKNEKTPRDTSLEVTAPCGAFGIRESVFREYFRGMKH